MQPQIQTAKLVIAIAPQQIANADKLASSLGITRNALWGVLADNVKPEMIKFDRSTLPRRGRRKANVQQQ